jgi:hypothetical protein
MRQSGVTREDKEIMYLCGFGAAERYASERNNCFAQSRVLNPTRQANSLDLTVSLSRHRGDISAEIETQHQRDCLSHLTILQVKNL